MAPQINLRDIFEWEKADNGLTLIRKFMELGMIPKEGDRKCDKCQQPMRLRLDQQQKDQYKWECSNYVSIRKQKRKRCRYTASVRKETFIEGSHLSLAEISSFVCCWVDNMPLTVIRKHVRTAEHTSVDFGNFCRELVYDHIFALSEPLGGPDGDRRIQVWSWQI